MNQLVCCKQCRAVMMADNGIMPRHPAVLTVNGPALPPTYHMHTSYDTIAICPYSGFGNLYFTLILEWSGVQPEHPVLRLVMPDPIPDAQSPDEVKEDPE